MLNRCLPALLLGSVLTAQAHSGDCRLSFQNGATLDLPVATTEAAQAQGWHGVHFKSAAQVTQDLQAWGLSEIGL